MLTFDYHSYLTLQVADADDFVINNAASNPDTETGYIWILTAPTS